MSQVGITDSGSLHQTILLVKTSVELVTVVNVVDVASRLVTESANAVV